ncbi:MAG: DUF748 domain-containing protein [Candidatus Omnitrophota bacterium]
MKILVKILIIAAIIFACVFVAAYVFLLLQGKTLIARQLEDLTQKKVDIGYVGLILPLNLEIKNLNIQGLARVERIFISPSIPGLLSGKIILNELTVTRPEVTYEKRSLTAGQGPNDTGIPKPIALPAKSTPKGSAAAQKDLPALALKTLNIKDGIVYFIDYTVGEGGVKVTLKNISLHLTNLYLYPHSAMTNFSLKGQIPWKAGQQEGSIELEGWLNLFKRDMQATLKLKDIDGVYLYPYYSEWVNLEKMRIEKAKLNVTSDLKSVDGNLTAPCHLELNDIVFKRQQVAEGEEADKTQKIVAAVMDIFSSFTKTNKVVFNFTVKSKIPAFY